MRNGCRNPIPGYGRTPFSRVHSLSGSIRALMGDELLPTMSAEVYRCRTFCHQLVSGGPPVATLQPTGIPIREPDEISRAQDDFEASGFADLGGRYRDQAAISVDLGSPGKTPDPRKGLAVSMGGRA